MVAPLDNRAVAAARVHASRQARVVHETAVLQTVREAPAVAPPAHQPEVRGPTATRAVVRRADVVATIVGPDPLVGVGRSGVQPAR